MKGQEKNMSLIFDATRFQFHDKDYEKEVNQSILDANPHFKEYENIGGVYSIWYKDQCLYVGCSKTIGMRWANHCRNITDKKSLEYNKHQYAEMRKVYNDLSFVVEEIFPYDEKYDKEEYFSQLQKLEKKYKIELQPIFDGSKDLFFQYIDI
jgi:hypothetical protein